MSRFIVDTSVWIDFFRGKLPIVVLQNLTVGIRDGFSTITDVIRHEIQVGAKNKKNYEELCYLLAPLECLRIREIELDEFDKFAWNLSKKGFLGKYTDASIAFLSSKHKLPILSFDDYFHRLADKKLIPQTIKF